MSAPLILGTNSIKDTGYNVDNSLRFNRGSSDSLSDTQTSGNRRTWTFSTWVKKCTNGNGVTGAIHGLMSALTSDYDGIHFHNTDAFRVYFNGTSSGLLVTNRLFRDNSAFYHTVVAVDTTQGTASNRVKIYINGVQETSFSTETYPSQNYDTFYNVSNTARVGRVEGSFYLDGYMSEVVFIDGQQLDPTSFGEFDEDSGIWKPIDVSGLTFGTNGFYLDFENSGSLGADVSGNGNNFTVNNLTAIDQTTDTPTNNFATGNPLDYSGTAPTLGNGNLSITSAELSDKPFRTTIAVSQGKWYMEYKCEKSGSDNDNHIGLWSAENSLTSNYVGYQLYSWGIFTGNGNKRNNQSYDSYGSAIAQNDIVMIALDKDNGKIWWGKNGTWFASGNPATGSNEAFSNINTVVGSNGFVSFCFLPQQKFSLNFGSPPFTISSGNTDGNGYGNFEYAVPSGYYSLNSKNLAEYG